MNNISNMSIDELKNIVLESTNKESDTFSEAVLNDRDFTFEYKEFKKHNRLDCTAWLSIFPYDFKIYLDKNNIITKTPFKEYKNKRILGRKLILS